MLNVMISSFKSLPVNCEVVLDSIEELAVVTACLELLPYRTRAPKFFQVYILNTVCLKSSREWILRESPLSRECDLSYVEDTLNRITFKTIEERLDIRPFVADCEQPHTHQKLNPTTIKYDLIVFFDTFA